MSLDLARCSVKTEAVRIQELSLAGEGEEQGTRNSPKRKQRPASGTLPTDLTTLSVELPADRKRGNKRALLTSVPSDRRKDGEAVEVQGMLVVAEQVDRGQMLQNPPVFRTLGSIYCVLVRKRGGLFLETVSKDSHHSIVLEVDAMDLVHEPFARDLKFQLRYRCRGLSDSGNGLRAPVYAFIASRKDEYSAWVNGIISHHGGGREQESSASKPGAMTVGAGPIQLQQGETGSNARRDDQLNQQRPQDEACVQRAQPSLGEFVYSTPPRTKHFILVRHGHYINAHVPQASDTQQVLSQMGRQQAELTGKHLGMAHNRVPTRHDVAIYHSDMTRAVETATIISGNFSEVALKPSPLLREGWPGTPYSTDFPVGGAAAARNNSALDAMEERSRADVERMEKAFNWFFSALGKPQEEEDEEESYCILVCHANLIRFFLCRALGVSPSSTWGHFEINHCGVTRIDVCVNRPIKVIAVNETGHLPQSLITSSEDHL